MSSTRWTTDAVTLLPASSSHTSLRYFLLLLLDLNYPHLDCFILGRFIFAGRLLKAGKCLAIIFSLAFASYRAVLIVGWPNFRSDCLKFLRGYQTVLDNEVRASKWRVYSGLLSRKRAGELAGESSCRRPAWTRSIKSTWTSSSTRPWPGRRTIRPNRTAESYLKRAKFNHLWNTSMIFIAIVIYICLCRSVAPIMTIRVGFQLNYRHWMCQVDPRAKAPRDNQCDSGRRPVEPVEPKRRLLSLRPSGRAVGQRAGGLEDGPRGPARSEPLPLAQGSLGHNRKPPPLHRACSSLSTLF